MEIKKLPKSSSEVQFGVFYNPEPTPDCNVTFEYCCCICAMLSTWCIVAFDFQDCAFSCRSCSLYLSFLLFFLLALPLAFCFCLCISCRDVIRKPLADSDREVFVSPF